MLANQLGNEIWDASPGAYAPFVGAIQSTARQCVSRCARDRPGPAREACIATMRSGSGGCKGDAVTGSSDVIDCGAHRVDADRVRW